MKSKCASSAGECLLNLWRIRHLLPHPAIRVHLVNNLLQLSEENTNTTSGHEWFCRGDLLENAGLSGEKKWLVATQEELDSIAARLTCLELQLMQGGVDSDHGQPKLTILQKIRSQHACPYLGNYSFEVITEALGRRGIGLQFVRPDDVDEEREHKQEHGVPLGYVIHLQGERSPFSALGLLNLIGRNVPVARNFFGSGGHWLAITAVRCMGDSDCKPSKKPEDEEPWLLIDSKSPDPMTFETNADLANYLKDGVQRNGGLIFKAFSVIEAHKG